MVISNKICHHKTVRFKCLLQCLRFTLFYMAFIYKFFNNFSQLNDIEILNNNLNQVIDVFCNKY